MFNKKIIGFLSIFIILTLTLGVVSASENATQTSNSTEIVDENPTETIKSFNEIQYAVENAAENDVITIDGYYQSSGSDISIHGDSLTIEGKAGTTLDGNNTSGIFFVEGMKKLDNGTYVEKAVTLTLKNLIIKNGAGVTYGGAIYSYNPESKIVLDNCTFINNKVIGTSTSSSSTIEATGGIVYGANIVATNSNFINTSGISSSIFDPRDSVSCTNCNFVNNTAMYHLIFANLGSKCTFKNCRFENNVAGLALIYCYETKLACENVTFINNKNAAFILDDVTSATINNKKFTGDYVLTDALKTIYYVKATTKAVSTTYNSGATLKITVTDSGNKLVSGYSLKVLVYTGSKYVTHSVETNSKGVATIKVSTLSIGSHKVVIKADNDFNSYAIKQVSTTVKVAKAKTTVKAPKVTNKYKKSKYFTVTIKNKATKKVVKSIKVKVKVYTGKKYKTYTIKTNSKGVAKLNTKKLKVGSHKVVIYSGNAKYTISAKSTIKIKR